MSLRLHFTAWDPIFDSFQAETHFGDATGIVYRVVRLTTFVQPVIQDNVIRTNSSDTVVVALSSTAELTLADFEPEAVRAGPARAGSANWYEGDLFEDGAPDPFVEFKARDLGIACDAELLATEVIDLSGQIGGRGYDEIIPTACGRGKLFADDSH